MPQITDIRPQTRPYRSYGGQKRFNIFLDGQYAFSLSAESLIKAGLKIDDHLSLPEIDRLIKENEFIKVYERVLKFLSFRPRSEKELEDYFHRQAVGEKTQKMVWAKLKHLGFVNDKEFAKWWIEQRAAFRPKGRKVLEMELRQKGISREIIEHETQNMKHLFKEDDLAKKAVSKKIKVWENYPQEEIRKKLSAYLLRRGFAWETIEKVIDEIDKKE